MKLLSVKPSTHPDKKYTATFCMCEGATKCCDSERKKVNFGSRGSSTFIDHHDPVKKKNYLARHKANENWNSPTTPGSLARFILWNKETLAASIKDFKKRFNL